MQDGSKTYSLKKKKKRENKNSVAIFYVLEFRVRVKWVVSLAFVFLDYQLINFQKFNG